MSRWDRERCEHLSAVKVKHRADRGGYQDWRCPDCGLRWTKAVGDETAPARNRWR